MSKFIKIYYEDSCDGYIPITDIIFFDVHCFRGNLSYDDNFYVVMAKEKCDENLEDGYTVSPKFSTSEKAYLFLEELIKEINT